MRLVAWLVLLAAAVFAYVTPTESLDVFYWASPSAVRVVGADGAELYTLDVVYPLVASDAVGRCFAVVNRPYVYQVLQQEIPVTISAPVDIELSEDILNALRQYGISLPKRLRVVLNFTLPLPPVIIAGVYKGAVVSLHTPYGYPHWATSLAGINASAVATNCVEVAVGTVDGRVVVVKDGRVVGSHKFPHPVTAMGYSRDGRELFVGTAGGEVYKIVGGSASRVYTCPGSVFNLAVAPDGTAVAACFVKDAAPRIYVMPYGVEFSPAITVTYGIDTPRAPMAASQDGQWVYLGLYGELVALRQRSVAWRASLPAPPLSIATSGDGSIVAVGTLGGHVVVFRNGVEAARLLAGRPVTSLAVSHDGKTVVYETWDRYGVAKFAAVRLSASAPRECLPVEVLVRSGEARYVYQVSGVRELLVPVGRLEVEPQYRYLGEVRCRPVANLTLEVTGDVAEVISVDYVLEYRVYKSPLVRGPDWASGSVVFYAEPQLKVPVYNTPGVAEGVMRLSGWLIDGRRVGLPTSSISVFIDKPISIEAIYVVSLPSALRINDTARLRLDDVVIFDQFGNPITSGRAPEVRMYPISAQGFYVPQALITTRWPATVNDTQSLWADLGSLVVFRTPEVYDFRNNTRLKFAGWAGLEHTKEEFATVISRTVERPIALNPRYVVQYRVWVKPPAYVAQPPNATWVDKGSEIVVNIPTPISESGGVRTVLRQWVVNGRPNATTTPLRVRVFEPLNITYTTKRQYLVRFSSRYGVVPPSMWVDEGSTVGIMPTPTEVWDPAPLIRYLFAGWRDVSTGVVYTYPAMPIAAAPTLYEAVWSLDPLPLAVVSGAAGGAAFLLWFMRKRRRRLAAEIAEE
ncbi:MAG: WD40 repeat domain-containing protein [Pyrobaculum sp.]